MTAALPSPSGLPAVDRQWGGFGPGRAYLLVGRAGAGRSALALQAARAAVDAGQRCLVISPRPPEALVDVGRGVGLDLAAAHASGRLRLLRIPSAEELAARGPEGLAAAYRDLAGLVASDGPDRVVVEDFTPLVQFDTFERFRDAFSDLVAALRSEGATLVIGLGDPANEASRQLLDVVEGLVDGTIRLGSGGDLRLALPSAPAYPTNDGGMAEAAPPPAPESPPAPSHDEVPPEPEAAASPLSAAPAPPEAEPDVAPPAPNPAPAPPAAPPAPEPAAAPGFSTTFAPSAGASEPASDAPAPAPTEAAPSAPGGVVHTDVVPPPAPDSSLLAPLGDTFGYDPADTVFDQGFLADSTGGRVLGTVGMAPAGLPSFAPLAGGPSGGPDAAFRPALDAAFAARSQGTPFQVVAVRMDSSAPQAAHFDAVAAGLRSALRTGDAALVDADRKRAAVVLPSSGPDAAQALFAGLQSHLRSALGAEAEAVLQAVAAVTIADGQPFQSAADLIAYAIEG